MKLAKWPWRSRSITSFFNTNKSILGCMFGANLVIPAQIRGESLRAQNQAQFPRILSQNCQNDLEGQGQWPLFSIPAESIPRSMFGAYLVILVQICDDLSCGQGKVHAQTDRRTDRRRQRQYPFGLKSQGVKKLWALLLPTSFSMLSDLIIQHSHPGSSFTDRGFVYIEASGSRPPFRRR